MGRKRILNMGQSVEVRSLIKKIGFRKSFNNRIVHSIYFDDLSNTAFRDNIEAVSYTHPSPRDRSVSRMPSSA